MAVWSEVEFRRIRESDRFDPEYYQPDVVEIERKLEAAEWELTTLGELILDGYRVVYENTDILTEDFDPENHVYFLQAADIRKGFPSIDVTSMGWVSYSDWERYPRGRIKRGEMLVEVKGKAEKVAIVPEDFPDNALATGTLYKMTIDESKINKYFLFVYLYSKLGHRLRDREKTNLLVSYVNKASLYGIVVPIPPVEIQREIADIFIQSQEAFSESLAIYKDAEDFLSLQLGFTAIDLSRQIAFESTLPNVLLVVHPR